MANLNFNADLENNLASYTTAGEVVFTEDNIYLVKTDGSKIKYSSIEVVSSLPISNISDNKIYILSTNFSLNYYDGTSWHTLGSNQIVIGTSNTDTTKLWLDISNTNSPVLNWHNGTSWINISASIDTSTLLDKTTYKGSADGIVKKADTLTDLISTPSQIDNTVANSISPNIANRSNGKVVTYNASTGEEEWADINITGVIGSTTITTISETTIPSGSEVVFNHPTSINVVPVIEEQIIGSSVTDTHVDFSNSSKYILQDSGKILAENNKAELDIYTKLLMHMDDSTFKDEVSHTVTNTGVVTNSTYKKFGLNSGYFNGSSSYLSVTNSTDFQFGTGDFTISWWEYMPTTITNASSLAFQSSASDSSFSALILGVNGSYKSVYLTSNGTSWDIANNIKLGNIITNSWVHYAICRKGTNIYLFQNGVLQNTIVTSSPLYYNASWKLFFGARASIYFNGYIDEVCILKGKALWISNFTLPITPYLTPYKTINTPLYLQTTGLSDYSLTTMDTITSLTIPVTLPSSSSTVKCLFSVDNKVNWLYYNGTSIQKFTGDLTLDWSTTSSSYTQLQTYFTNKTIVSLTSDLSGLGIIPINLDFCFQLNTTDINQTPSISTMTMIYTNKPHNEFASIGKYSDAYVEFGVKRISNSSIGVKNLTSSSKTIKVNLVTSV